jgi:uncharacterized protein YgiB involved in biofilm formation
MCIPSMRIRVSNAGKGFMGLAGHTQGKTAPAPKIPCLTVVPLSAVGEGLGVRATPYISNDPCSPDGTTRSACATPINNAALGIAKPLPSNNSPTVRTCKRGIRKFPNGVV